MCVCCIFSSFVGVKSEIYREGEGGDVVARGLECWKSEIIVSLYFISL